MVSRDEAVRSSARNFLSGGGEMGSLMRAHDWSETSLGPPESWPQPLRMAIRLLLNSGHPMYVWWGPDLLCFYNDAYRQSIGPERHPGSLGHPAREVWAEIWDIIGPQIEQVMSGGGSTWNQNQLVPITRGGVREEVYWTYSYGPIDDETAGSGVGGVLVICSETTQTVLAERRAAEAQEHQKQMLRQMPGFVGMLSGPDLVYTYVNDAYVAISERADFVGRRFRDVFADIEGQGYFEAFENAFRTGEGAVTRGMELRLHGRDEKQYIDFVLEPVRDDAGAITGLFVGGYETTEVYRGHEALRESEARLAFLDRLGAETASLVEANAVLASTTRLLGEHLNVSVCAYADMDEDEDGFTIRGDWAAPGSTSIIGHYSLADFGKLAVKNLGAGLPLIVNDNLRELAPDEAATFQNIGIAATICMPLVKEGRLTALMAIHDRAPRVWTDAELSLLREVTARSWAHVERVGTAAALMESEERLRLATDHGEIGFWDVDLVQDELIWPPRVKAMFGIPADAPVTMADFYNGLHQEDRERTSAAFESTCDPARRTLYEVEYRTVGREDGKLRWVAARGRGIFMGDQCVRVVGIAVDVTARKETESALQESEARVRALTDNLPSGMVYQLWTGPDGTDRKFLYVSQSHEKLTGVPAEAVMADPTLPYSLILPDDLHGLAEAESRSIGANCAFDAEARFRRTDGQVRWCRIISAPREQADGSIIWDGMQIDITDHKEAEASLRELNETLEHRVSEEVGRRASAEDALRQSQKLEAMGQLTGGVAHDFNNLLTPIVGSLDMLQRKGLGDDRDQRLIEGAIQSAERARLLVQRLLAFARRQPLQPVAVDVRQVIEGMAELISSTTGPQVKVTVEASHDLPSAMADPNQLEMALLNLAVNARDAMPAGGTLRLSADLADTDADSTDLVGGRYVRLSVADTGAGMDKATLHRAIEPFFSTKGVGKGTGLGLSMVHGLATQLGGTLRIYSRPGLGTNVELWLPVTDAEVAAVEVLAETSGSGERQGQVLLVDDEELVRTSTAAMLSELGFSVTEADSAEHALSLLNGGLVPDMLITDHLMPGMSGTELARVVQSTSPITYTLIISGYAEADGIAPDLPRLTKPFRQEQLAAMLPRDRNATSPNPD